ncbi:hypothetical protein V7124_04180 [Neobacillus niacini]|uniref:hypothetical protein n=1 Tax=Neobacillus niacini TaxID=86668 RepID=UPI0030006C32
MLIGRRSINLEEYTCVSARTKHSRLIIKTRTGPTQLHFSALRVSVALARTILSINPRRIELAFQSMSSILSLQTLVGNTKKLALVDDINLKFRDFSLTTRVGELAQAISYLFAQDILGKPIIVDFEGYLRSQGHYIKVDKQSSPDFVLCDSLKAKQIDLLESKGSTVNQVKNGLKSTLRVALEQCDSGKSILAASPIGSAVKNSFGTVVLFPEESVTSWDACVHFSDPEIETDVTVKDPLALIKYHFASWFMLIGLTEEAVGLASGENLQMMQPIEEKIVDDKKYYILNKSHGLFPNIINDDFFAKIGSEKKKYGIASEVFELLSTGDFQSIKDHLLIYNPISNDDMELFSDGTIILY